MTEWAAIAKWAVAWGPGVVILAGLYMLIRRPPAFVGAFIDAQTSQAVAMTKMADAVERATARDNDRLDEILINDQVILRRIEELSHDIGTPHA
jgi:hypothetical protein